MRGVISTFPGRRNVDMAPLTSTGYLGTGYYGAGGVEYRALIFASFAGSL